MTELPARQGLDATSQDTPHIAIVGGGIAGMSAAYYLQRAAHAAGLEVRTTLIERDVRLGGKIVTERLGEGGQFVVEGGPDSFVAQKPWAVELARELGLGDELIGSNPLPRTTCVLHRGRPHPLPEGTQLIVPTRLLPFARTPLLSPLGKLRVALDLVIPPRAADGDESLAEFIRRRMGAEALDRLAEPLLAGIHNADCERQSLLATFPRFRDMERRHGGLIRGALAARRERERRSSPQSPLAAAPFVTLRGGVGALVEALAPRLEGDVITGCGVRRLEHDPTAARAYRLHLDDGRAIEADAVVMAAPASVAAGLVAPFQPELAAALRAIRFVSTATISLAYPREAIRRPLDGYGVVIPRRERRRINALTVSSDKFRHRAPEGYALVRAFVGGSRTPEALELDDEGLVALARDELRQILGVEGEPVLARVYRWLNANPQYEVGHLERVDRLEALCPPGLHLAGCAYRGVGIPDCVRQGREAAERALALVMGRAAV
ncbi:MAG: protoporphyrinogen oxidase [Chloroflexota bacterium]|nr:MAG: protoporphyrinogen oxidase [Chloroflexota bacterium]